MLRFWQPSSVWRFAGEISGEATASDSKKMAGAKIATHNYTGGEIAHAWVPWIILSVCVFLWGWPQFRTFLDGGEAISSPPNVSSVAAVVPAGEAVKEASQAWWVRPNYLAGISERRWLVPQLHEQVQPDAAVIGGDGKPKSAEYRFNWLSATGTGILVAAVLSGVWMGVSPYQFGRLFLHTLYRLRWPLFTISCMLAIAYTTQYSGTDVTLGLAFTHTGVLYPFFATILGWLGVALTGSDTSSNALFGNLQRITAERLGLNPVLICAANSTGGVMGKMIDAQSIVVASAATGQHGQEGRILRFVFWHSVILAVLVGLLTLVQAYLLPGMIPSK
jgi:lactate permease